MSRKKYERGQDDETIYTIAMAICANLIDEIEQTTPGVWDGCTDGKMIRLQEHLENRTKRILKRYIA